MERLSRLFIVSFIHNWRYCDWPGDSNDEYGQLLHNKIKITGTSSTGLLESVSDCQAKLAVFGANREDKICAPEAEKTVDHRKRMENQEDGDQKDEKEVSAQSETTDVEPPAEAEKPPESQQQLQPLQTPQPGLTCWLYVSRTCGLDQQEANRAGRADGLPRASLEEAIRSVEPAGPWHVNETHCGLIVGFAREADADKLLQRRDLARIFEGPVQVARFCDRDCRYRQAVLLRDVPWAIPLQDLNSALARQGIATGTVERLRHYVRVEVLESGQYEQLLRQGLDFFGAARFCAIPERWWRNGDRGGGGGPFNGTNQPAALEVGTGQQQPVPVPPQPPPAQQSPVDDVLQCYRCQGFWHVAANCRHLPRCVRCGEPHSVEFCARPRNNPICCHCSGPHHAGYRQCPVRLQLLNATQVSLTLSANRLSSSAPANQLLLPYKSGGGANNNSGANNGNNATLQNNAVKSNQTN